MMVPEIVSPPPVSLSLPGPPFPARRSPPTLGTSHIALKRGGDAVLIHPECGTLPHKPLPRKRGALP